MERIPANYFAFVALLFVFSSCAHPDACSPGIDAMTGKWRDIQPGVGLSGWTILGEANFEVVTEDESGDQVLMGYGDNRANSFLVSEDVFADFELELEVRIQPGGNSGIQVRSQLVNNDGVRGYQIEVDSSSRSWSGGLYDERRRGWLHSLAENEAGRTSFKVGEWNHYRIVCQGDHIRSWVNGVPCADWHDDKDANGFIGLQVHGGGATRVEFKNLRIRGIFF